MANSESENRMLRLYESRIGEPASVDEVYGYYVFLVGALLAGIGILWFLVAASGSGGPSTREFGYVLAAGGFLLLLAGAVYRLPLADRATYAVYVGGVISLAGLGLFATQFPQQWAVGTSSSNLVILLYVGGIAIIALGTLIAPTDRGQTASEFRREQEAARDRAENEARGERIAELEAELGKVTAERDELRAERDDLQAERDELRAERDDLEAERDDLEANATNCGQSVTSYGPSATNWTPNSLTWKRSATTCSTRRPPNGTPGRRSPPGPTSWVRRSPRLGRNKRPRGPGSNGCRRARRRSMSTATRRASGGGG